MSQVLAGIPREKIRELLNRYREDIKRKTCQGWHDWFKGLCYSFVDLAVASATVVDIIIDLMAKLIEGVTDAIEVMGLDAKVGIARDSESDAYRTLALTLNLEVLVNTLIDILQTKIMGSGVELRALTSFISNIVTFDHVYRSAIAMKSEKAYLFWLEKLYNKLYLPYIPDPSTAISLYYQGHISKRDMENYLLMNAIPRWVWKYLMDRVSRNPTIPELINFYQFTDVSEEWIKQMLRINNTADLTDIWLKYIKGVALRDELRKVEGYVKTLFAQGWISEKEINDLLWRYKARKEEKDVLENVWKKLKDKELKKLYLDKHIYLLRRRRIKCKDLEDRARALYGDPAFAQAIAMKECAYLGYDYPTEDVQA